jgi:hypothetical protein
LSGLKARTQIGSHFADLIAKIHQTVKPRHGLIVNLFPNESAHKILHTANAKVGRCDFVLQELSYFAEAAHENAQRHR